jgi:hypothetical protein
MRRALVAATDRVPVPSRTPAAKAKMAQRIVMSAPRCPPARGGGGRRHGACALGKLGGFQAPKGTKSQRVTPSSSAYAILSAQQPCDIKRIPTPLRTLERDTHDPRRPGPDLRA